MRDTPEHISIFIRIECNLIFLLSISKLEVISFYTDSMLIVYHLWLKNPFDESAQCYKRILKIRISYSKMAIDELSLFYSFPSVYLTWLTFSALIKTDVHYLEVHLLKVINSIIRQTILNFYGYYPTILSSLTVF